MKNIFFLNNTTLILLSLSSCTQESFMEKNYSLKAMAPSTEIDCRKNLKNGFDQFSFPILQSDVVERGMLEMKAPKDVIEFVLRIVNNPNHKREFEKFNNSILSKYDEFINTVLNIFITKKLFFESSDIIKKMSVIAEITNRKIREKKDIAKVLSEMAIQASKASVEESQIARQANEAASEIVRQANEREVSQTARQANEIARQANEVARKRNETARQANEAARKTNEIAEKASKKTEEASEMARKASEMARQANEIVVEVSEMAKEANEREIKEKVARQVNERARQANERARQANEVAREVNEIIRDANEVTREKMKIAKKISEAQTYVEPFKKEMDSYRGRSISSLKKDKEFRKFLNQSLYFLDQIHELDKISNLLKTNKKSKYLMSLEKDIRLFTYFF